MHLPFHELAMYGVGISPNLDTVNMRLKYDTIYIIKSQASCKSLQKVYLLCKWLGSRKSDKQPKRKDQEVALLVFSLYCVEL